MASHQNEVVAELFRHRRELAADLLRGPLGVTLPRYRQARLGDSEVVEPRPAAHRANVVVVLDDGARPVTAVGQAMGVAGVRGRVRRRLRCPPGLLVVCTDAATARSASKPMDLAGCSSQVVPRVPEAVPVVTDPAEAVRAPEVAVPSALAHVGADGPFEVLDAPGIALDHVKTAQAVEYALLVLNALRTGPCHAVRTGVRRGALGRPRPGPTRRRVGWAECATGSGTSPQPPVFGASLGTSRACRPPRSLTSGASCSVIAASRTQRCRPDAWLAAPA